MLFSDGLGNGRWTNLAGWLSLFLIMCGTARVNASVGSLTHEVVLGWVPSPATNLVSGYYVLSGTASGVYTNQMDVGLTNSVTITGLQIDVAYYFVVVAHSSTGQTSPPSNEVEYIVPSNAPPVFLSISHSDAGLTLDWSATTGQTYQVQYCSDLAEGNWTNLGGSIPATNVLETFTDPVNAAPQRFYRVLVVP